MRFLFSVTLLFCFTTPSFAQKNKKDIYVSLASGRVSFGSGDMLGYAILLDASKNIVKKPSIGKNKFLVGAALIYEQGVKNPVVQNPTGEQFFSKTFYHVSATTIWPKIAYHPFGGFAKGFQIQTGPTLSYSNRSQEVRASRVIDPNGESVRTSTLFFNNGVAVGYRVSLGLDVNITPNFFMGIRADFSGNTEAELNTFGGIKAGISF